MFDPQSKLWLLALMELERIRRHSFFRKCSFLALALILMEIGLNIPTTSAQPAFLSIDCGSSQDSYTDSAGLKWVTDSGQYMNIGETIEQPPVNEIQASRSFRYFPESRSKYCYELPTPVQTQNSFLIRASFYMSESLRNTTQFSGVKFTLSLGATDWFTLSNIVGESQGFLSVVEEAIFYPGQVLNHITNVCLQTVVGNPFISSLELRVLGEDTYSYQYPGSIKQYLALAFRYNLGAQSTAPNVRYPDDIYDRIWTTPDGSWNIGCPSVSIPEAPDTNISSNAYWVPPKVMKDAWLLDSTGGCGDVNFPVYVNGPVYMTPAAYFFLSVYTEHLNTTDSDIYTETVYLIEDLLVYPQNGSFSQTAYMHTFSYQDFSKNYVHLGIELSDPSLNDGPTLNAVEVYGQYNYNFSTTIDSDVTAITALKTGFSLTNWHGDPCTPVPHDWLSCEASLLILGDFGQPCSDETLTSVGECRAPEGAPQADLVTKYYVTSINLSNHTSSGFSGVIGNTSAFPTPVFLNSLNNMSITNSGVDSATCQFLITSTSGSVNMSNLDLSYNAIDYIPPASDWAGLENLTSVNLAHNNLTGELSPSEDVLFFNKLQHLNLSYNAMTSFLTMWTNTTRSLVGLDLSYNQLQEDMSTLDKWVQINNESLQELNVSNNNLGGAFSSDLYFQGLPKLRIAHFDQNSIEGILNLSAWFTALQAANNAYSTNSSIPDVTQLFSFIGNNISEIFPTVESLDSTIRRLTENTQGSFSMSGILLGGNPYCRSFSSAMHEYLCRSSTSVLLKPPYPQRHNNRKLILIIGICGGLGGVLFFIVMPTTLWSLWKQVYALREVQKELGERKVQPPFYRYSDLKLATRNFSMDNKLGQGAFGIVYKGDFADKTPIGVKKLFNQQRLQVLDEFLNEVVLITGIKHRNLVQLKGCCIERKQRILVYEYAEKGNLAEALWGSQAYGCLTWEQRTKICVGVARGLSYLHEELQPSIIHRDIKPENILLDANLSPKIADFGLARYVSDDPSYAHSTKVAGTIGYFAPEYIMQGELSDKIDVYSYGVLILEIVSGRKCIDPSRPTEEKFLTNWVASMKENDLLFEVLQHELREHCVMAEVIRAIHIGLLCVQHLPERRPTMSQVVTMFLGNLDISVVPDESDDIQKNFNHLLGTIDSGIEYPTLKVIEEDSSDFPLLVLESLSSFHNTSSGSGSRPLTELSTIYAR